MVKNKNLTLTTNTLTYENIYDKDKARSFGVGVSGENTKDETGKKIEGKGTKGGSVDYSMHHKQQTNNATIGLGDIVVGGINSNDDSSVTGGINRDINKSQVITKDLSVKPIHVEYTKYEKKTKLDENGNEVEMSYGESLKDGVMDWVDPRDELKETSENLAKIPGSPVWVSRYVDRNNNTTDDMGNPVDNPAPHLKPGILLIKTGKKPNIGRQDDKCYDSFICRNLASDKSLIMKGLYYPLPGFPSGGDYHDANTPNKQNGLIKGLTIAPYFLLNYYGSVGTYLDTKTYKNTTNK